MIPVMYEVVSRSWDADDVATIAVAPVDEAIVAPAPGQFTMMWAFGIGESPISTAEVQGDVLVHTIRDVGAVTAALTTAQIGEQIGIRGPFGRGWGIDFAEGHDVAVVAGGLGLPPLKPLVLGLLAEPERFGKVSVLVGARTPDGLLYPDDLDAWSKSATVETTVDAATPSWTGNVGLVTTLIDKIDFDTTNGRVFVCGPEIMMTSTAKEFAARGVPAEHIRISIERNMHCAVAQCGRCQLGPLFICKDGPVQEWSEVAQVLEIGGR